MKLKILQLKNTREYGFMPYDFAKEWGFKLSDYDTVYEENIDSDTSLDELYIKFQHENPDCPADFKGHSLSTSDIIELDGHKYYCDSFDWQEIEEDLTK